MKPRHVISLLAVATASIALLLWIAREHGPANRGAAAVTAARLLAADTEPGNWMSTGRGYDEQRYSPLDAIDTGNVAQLGLAWTHRLDLDRGIEATPLVIDGVMYTTGAYGVVYALKADTGELIWKHDPKVPMDTVRDGCCGPVNRGVAAWNGKIYVGAFDGRLIALDAASGAVAWSVDTIADHGRSYTITGAPRVVKGKVIIGNGGAEFGVRGYVSAYDAEDGKPLWRFYTVPGDPALPPESEAMAKARATWAGEQYWKHGGGGTVWDSLAYDAQLDLLYVGTGNGSLWNRQVRSAGEGDNLYVSSIVALRPDSGEYVWHYQTTPGDQWDFTATQHMILADLAIDGVPRKVLMQAPKNGFFYVLDRVTGKLISAKNFVPVNWAERIDLDSGRPVANPAADWTRGPALVMPGPLGAHSWMPMSFSPRTGLVYLPAQEVPALLAPDNNAVWQGKGIFQTGTQAPALPEDAAGLQAVASHYRGYLLAWDPVTQREVWRQPYSTVWNGGTLATAGGLVFQGTADGRFVAYAADSGRKLWEAPANTGVMAGPISYSVNGEQYVAVMAGWGGAFPLGFAALAPSAKIEPEARILVYKLGATASLPAPQNKPVQPSAELPAFTADAAALQQGRALYNTRCGLCHGLSLYGGVLPDLRYLSTDKHRLFAGIVAGAYAERGMPSFAGQFSAAEIEAIHQYVIRRTLDLRAELAP